MYRVSIEKKLKRLVMYSAFFAFFAAIAALGGLFLFTDLSLGAFGIGAAIAVVVILIGTFVLFSMASAWAGEVSGDAGQLSRTISAMAAGNFNVNLRTDRADELGQIEMAVALYGQMQKDLIKDVAVIGKCNGVLVDDKNYSGDYRELVKSINNAVSGYSNTISATTNAMKSLANGDMKSNFSGVARNEIVGAFDDLRRKYEAMNNELQSSVSAVESSKREINSLREDVAAAKKEAANAKDEAAAAKREAASAVPQPRVPSAPLKPGSPTYRSVSAPKPPGPNRLMTNNASSLTTNSSKVVAPSGAHEYDRKDYGKY